MRNSKTRDLTSGAPMGLLLSFMLPLLLGMLFQQCYNMVDTVVVGKALGVQALAGVGSTGSISFLVLGLCNGICAGFAIPVAQRFGRRDYDGVRKFVGNMILLTAVFAGIITLVTAANCRNILIWMKNPEDTFQYAYDYILLIFLGIPATMLYNLLSGIIRSLGDSRTPLYFLIFSSLLNVALDLLFIVRFHMGVSGAGAA
ncbi:MAG: MATE family efflux transporter, partial [Candidatus Faecousia sp.]|nr:MATE family efflux transporter [Candidatus Faecousia sp.]